MRKTFVFIKGCVRQCVRAMPCLLLIGNAFHATKLLVNPLVRFFGQRPRSGRTIVWPKAVTKPLISTYGRTNGQTLLKRCIAASKKKQSKWYDHLFVRHGNKPCVSCTPAMEMAWHASNVTNNANAIPNILILLQFVFLTWKKNLEIALFLTF